MTERLPVVILAGGVATRLRPLTQTIPKALVDVNGSPFIDHQLRLLRRNTVERVVVCAGHLGEMIEEHVGSGEHFGLSIDFVFDGPRLLGTGGAIKRALPMIGDAFFVLYGDSYLDCDYGAVQTRFEASRMLALMTVFANQGRWETSNVEYANGRIAVYDKRHPTPAMRHVDYGLGVFSARAFDLETDHDAFDLADLYQELARRNELAAYEVAHRFYEIGSFAGLEETRRHLAARA